MNTTHRTVRSFAVSRGRWLGLVAALALAVAACGTEPAATPSGTPSPTPTAAGPCDNLGEDASAPAFVAVSSPVTGDAVATGFEVTGCANVFEATVVWGLDDADGSEIATGFTTASCGTGCVGTYSFTVDYTVSEDQAGTLRVFTTSANDGSVEDLNEVPLNLTA